MQAVIDTKYALEQLCIDIKTFQDKTLSRAVYRAPIIDHFHPDDYSQKGIAGLSKFRDSVEAEIGYVQGIVESGVAPKDFTTNAPNLLAVWAEFARAKWPIVSIGLCTGGASKGQTKIDIVANGGNEWIKVNTIKTQRLLAEFREQDSYINSDYDSDSPSLNTPDRHALSNSIIKQAQTLVSAAKTEYRPVNLPPPRIRLILTRMEERGESSYDDDRIPATFRLIRDLGVDLVVGSECPVPLRGSAASVAPSRHILLDLSVVIALCCDSTHHPLPTSEEELESRFRPFTLGKKSHELEPHVNVTKDLRNQLQWEWSHPLAEELDDRLAEAGYRPEELHFWVTREVKDRMPGIVDTIGGPDEKIRAKDLFGETGSSFWTGSRYEERTKVLKDIRVGIMPDVIAESGEGIRLTTFEAGVVHACQSLLDGPDTRKRDIDSRGAASVPSRQSRNPKRIDTQFPPTTRAPSAHTLRTMLAGVQNGMTVLTNNRGAVGKIIRDMGVHGGFPEDELGSKSPGNQRAAIWVVNPSSLCEWRRLQVEERNGILSQANGNQPHA